MFVSDNKVKSIFRYFINELSQIYDEREAKNMSEIVFQDIFSWNKIELKQNLETQLSESELLKLNTILKRLKTHEPLQYVLGKTEFYGLPFKTDKRALIPRPETEELVDLILKENQNETIRILDIGTGTGCIALALKMHLPKAEVVGIDISRDAIELAKENAQLNKVEVEFLCQDVFSDDVLKLDNFDVIVSNPPYIEEEEKTEMRQNVLDFEPHNALFVNKSKLEFYDRITQISRELFNKNGKLYFELNEHYKYDYQKLFESNLFTFKFIKDLNDRHRIAVLSS